MNLRLIIGGIAASAITFIIVAVFLLQENLAKFLINPRIPYETYVPPQAPEYATSEAWLSWPAANSEKLVDVFYIPSTAYRSPEHWNAPLDDAPALATLNKVLLPNEAGPFSEIGDIYAPHYRQATLFAFFTQKHQGHEARKTAYADVRKAFMYFLAQADETRPLVLVGYGQGGLHLQGLLIDYFQDNPGLRKRVLGIYIIDQSTPLDMFNYALAETPPCKYPTDVRCVISWNAYEARHEDEIWRKQNRLMVWDGDGNLKSIEKRPLLCTNPLDWKLTDDFISRESHLGAASSTGLKFGERPALIEKAVSVQCDSGIATISKPRQRWLQRPHGFGKQWQSVDYNLFYEDIRVNLEQRFIALATVLEQEARLAPPMVQAVDVEEAPINKVPKQR